MSSAPGLIISGCANLPRAVPLFLSYRFLQALASLQTRPGTCARAAHLDHGGCADLFVISVVSVVSVVSVKNAGLNEQAPCCPSLREQRTWIMLAALTGMLHSSSISWNAASGLHGSAAAYACDITDGGRVRV